MSAVDARKEHYEAVEILGIPGLFTTLRIDRATIPKGVYAYDMQTSEQDWSQPLSACPAYHGGAFRYCSDSKPCSHPVQWLS